MAHSQLSINQNVQTFGPTSGFANQNAVPIAASGSQLHINSLPEVSQIVQSDPSLSKYFHKWREKVNLQAF